MSQLPSPLILTLTSEEDTARLAQACAQILPFGTWLGLTGDLGVGKTAFVRHLLMAMGWKTAVKSPTFTLVEPYNLPQGTVYHFDWYRLENAEELEYIGIRDYVQSDALVIIEWPERGFAYFEPHGDLLFSFRYHSLGREVTVTALSMEGAQCISALKALPDCLASF